MTPHNSSSQFEPPLRAHLEAALEHLEDADLDAALNAGPGLKQVELVAEEVLLLLHLHVEHGRLAA
jgi:hypothetical protein